MAKKKKKDKNQDEYYEELKARLDIEKSVEQTQEITTTEESSSRQKPTSVGRMDEEEEQEESPSDEDSDDKEEEGEEKDNDEDKKEEGKEKKDKDDKNKDKKKDKDSKKEKDDLGDKAKDKTKKKVGKKTIKKGAKKAGKAAKAAGQAIKRAGVALVRALAVLWEAAPLLVIILGVLILVLAVIAIFSFRGTDIPELPDQEIAQDRQAVGEASCWAGDCDQAVKEAEDLAKEAGEEIEEELETEKALNRLGLFARAQDSKDDIVIKNIEEKKERLETNFSALSAIIENKEASLNIAIDNYQLIKSTIADVNKDNYLKESQPVLESLGRLGEYNERIMLALKAATKGQKKPVLAINQYDLRLMKEFKIDIRVINLLNELARRTQAEKGEGIENLTEDQIFEIFRSPNIIQAKKIDQLTKPNKEWSQIKISRLTQFEPESKEEQVSSESEASHSAHYGGKAIDISVVGNYKCEKKGVLGIGDKTSWHPAHVAYQTDYRPPGLANYLNPNLNNLASVIRLPSNENSYQNIDKAIMAAGINQIAEELNIEPRYLVDSEISTVGLGSAHLENSLNLPVGSLSSIVASDQEAEINIGRRYLETIFGLPQGSVKGNSQKELIKSIGLAILKNGLDIENSDWQGDWNDYELGKAYIQSSYRVNDSTESFNKIINNNPQQFKRKMGLKNISDNLETTIREVGASHRKKLANSQTNTGLSKGLGLPADTIDGLTTNKDHSLYSAGITQLANILNIENGPNLTDEEFFEILRSNQNLKLPLGLSQTQIATIIADDNDQQRTDELKNLGQRVIERIKDQHIDSLAREKLSELTGVDYYQVGAEDLKNLLKDSDKTDEYIRLVGDNIEKDLFYHYRPNFGNYRLTLYDYEDVKDGNWQEVVNRIGSSYMESELGLPGGSFMAIVDGGSNTDESIARAGLALILKNLGVTETNNYGWFDEGSNGLEIEIGQAVVESKGLTSGSFFKDIGAIIEQNGKARVAASFNISVEELDTIMETEEVPDETIMRKLSWTDSSLDLDRDTTWRLFNGEIKPEDYAKRVAQSQLFGLSNKELADLVGIEERPNINGSIVDLILDPNPNNDKLIDSLSSLYDRYASQELGWPKDLLVSQIRNDEDSRDRALSAGIDRLSLILTEGNQGRANILSNLLDRSYVRGETINQDQYLEAGLAFIGISGSTIEDRDVLSNLLNGQISQAFNSIEETVIRDQTQNTLIGSWIDLRLDGAIGLTRAEIDLIKEAYSAWQNDKIGSARLISVLNSNFEVVDPAVERVIRGENMDYLDMTEMFFDDEFQQFAGLTVSQARNIRDTYEAYSDGNLSEEDMYYNLASSMGIDRDLMESARITDTLISGGSLSTGGIGYLAYQIGIGEEIDDATGIQGFSRGLIVGLTTGNWLDLGVSVLGDLFGWGQTKCQDPTKITQKHIRELTGWALRAEETPLQIGVFREEDVNYFNGLTDDGSEDDPTRPNLIYEKYGPEEDRGNRGLFANNHMWNHIHIGY